MDNKEFEDRLEQIKTFKEVPISVDEKIQKAFDRIEESEKIEKEVKKQKGKFNFSRVLSLAASFVMAIFLAGNGVAYAKGEPNIYSWVLEKIGIQKEYEEIKTDINQTVESDGIEIKLIDLGYDANSLIIGMEIEDKEGKFSTTPSRYRNEIESEEEYIEFVINNMIFSECYEIFTNESNDAMVLGNIHMDISDGEASQRFSDLIEDEFEVENVIERTSENSYILYKIIDTSRVDLQGKITRINLYFDAIYSQAQMIGGAIDTPISRGDWYFEVNNLTESNNEYSSHMVILNEKIDDILTINAIEIKNAKVFDIIRFDTNYTTVADGYFIAREDVLYFTKIVDESNNILGEIEDSALEFYYRINNLDINKEYRLLIYKVYIGENQDYNYDKYLEGKLKPINTITFKLNEENRLINTYKFKEEIVYATNDVSGHEYKIEEIIIENYINNSEIKLYSNGSKPGYENVVRIVNENDEVKCEFNVIGNENSKLIDLLEKGKYSIEIYEYEPDYTKYDPVYEDPVYSEEDLELVTTSQVELK